MPKVSSSVAVMLLALCVFIVPAHAGDDEIWMASAQKEAERDGYRLIDSIGVLELIESGSDPLIVDVRADYEFEGGHIPGASNMEFDLGDKMDLSPDKRKRFQDITGQDKKRTVVIYCRSFR